MNIFGYIKLLILMVLALGLILGIVSKKKISKYIIGLIFFPVILLIGYDFIDGLLSILDPTERLIAILIIAFIGILIVLLMTKTGREIFAAVVGSFIYDVLKLIGKSVSNLLFGFKRFFKIK